jgi:predicted enzyme related to lactoylglutathione lyase
MSSGSPDRPSRRPISEQPEKEKPVPKRDRAPVGAPCWVDLYSSDPDKSEAFYGQLFSWTAESGGEEYGGYITFSKDGQPVAGCIKNDGQSGIPDTWSVYLATNDAKATADAAAARGGQVVVPPMDVTDLGTMAVVIDVGQASIGMWRPGTFPGFAVFGEPGTPNWFELHTRAYDDSVKFYQDVFKWETHVASDTPDFRYTTLGEGDSALAGIMDASGMLPEGAPGRWGIYFGVENADAASSRITDLGGSIVRPAEDTPYGRLAEATDPTGATFKLIQPPS